MSKCEGVGVRKTVSKGNCQCDRNDKKEKTKIQIPKSLDEYCKKFGVCFEKNESTCGGKNTSSAGAPSKPSQGGASNQSAIPCSDPSKRIPKVKIVPCPCPKVDFLTFLKPKAVKITKHDLGCCPLGNGEVNGFRHPVCSWFASPKYFHVCRGNRKKCCGPCPLYNNERKLCNCVLGNRSDPSRRVSSNTLHGVRSLNDLRSWSACCDDQRRYFLEKMLMSGHDAEGKEDTGDEEIEDDGSAGPEKKYENLLNKKDDEIERLKKLLRDAASQGKEGGSSGTKPATKTASGTKVDENTRKSVPAVGSGSGKKSKSSSDLGSGGGSGGIDADANNQRGKSASSVKSKDSSPGEENVALTDSKNAKATSSTGSGNAKTSSSIGSTGTPTKAESGRVSASEKGLDDQASETGTVASTKESKKLGESTSSKGSALQTVESEVKKSSSSLFGEGAGEQTEEKVAEDGGVSEDEDVEESGLDDTENKGPLEEDLFEDEPPEEEALRMDSDTEDVPGDLVSDSQARPASTDKLGESTVSPISKEDLEGIDPLGPNEELSDELYFILPDDESLDLSGAAAKASASKTTARHPITFNLKSLMHEARPEVTCVCPRDSPEVYSAPPSHEVCARLIDGPGVSEQNYGDDDFARLCDMMQQNSGDWNYMDTNFAGAGQGDLTPEEFAAALMLLQQTLESQEIPIDQATGTYNQNEMVDPCQGVMQDQLCLMQQQLASLEHQLCERNQVERNLQAAMDATAAQLRTVREGSEFTRGLLQNAELTIDQMRQQNMHLIQGASPCYSPNQMVYNNPTPPQYAQSFNCNGNQNQFYPNQPQQGQSYPPNANNGCYNYRTF